MGNRMQTIGRILGYLPYFRRPVLWPEFGRRALRRLHPGYNSTDPRKEAEQRQQAETWCASKAIDVPTALSRLFDDTATVLSLEAIAPTAIRDAGDRIESCPVRMGGAGNLDLLYTLCEKIQAHTVIETGVAYGWSSLAILLSLSNRSNSHLYSVDLPYFELHNERWVGLAVPGSLKEYWTLYQMADREGIPRAISAIPNQADLIHYDSDKSYEGRMWAYSRLWDVLRPGGLFISDDINDNLGFHDFCQQIQGGYFIIRDHGKYQGLIRKP